jgi:predicted  nucleic acid-binding Zn-ribbon protein
MIYIRADRIEEVERERDDYAHKLMEANNTYSDMHLDIERLSDKLAKAVEALREIAGSVPYADNPWHIALAVLAELEGKE